MMILGRLGIWEYCLLLVCPRLLAWCRSWRQAKLFWRRNIWKCDRLSSRLASALATVGRGESPVQDLAERMCTRYTLSTLTQAASYWVRFHALLADAQLWGEYIGGYRPAIGEGGHFFILEILILMTSTGIAPLPLKMKVMSLWYTHRYLLLSVSPFYYFAV